MSLTSEQLQRLRTLQGALSSLSHEYEDVIPLLQSAVKDGNDTAIGMLKDQTNGLAAIKTAVGNIDIDTSDLAKQTQVKDGNDTAISVGKEIRGEVGTGSDTAAETGTLFAIVKWIKNKVNAITGYALQGANPNANISDIQTLIGYTIQEIDGV